MQHFFSDVINGLNMNFAVVARTTIYSWGIL